MRSILPPHGEIECNKRLVEEVSEELGLPGSVVQSIIHFCGEFTAQTVQAGKLEGVCFPYLGKFHVKFDSLQYKNYVLALHPELRSLFTEAINSPGAPKLRDLLQNDDCEPESGAFAD